MNFFKSSFFSDFKLQDVLVSHDDVPSASGDSDSGITSEKEEVSHDAVNDRDPVSDSGSPAPSLPNEDKPEQGTGIWNLGTLVKSLTSKSEGIIDIYRRDLEEFSSGLRKETKIIAEVAANAVKDLPTSLEARAFMAQGSIESVGQVVEDFSSSVWRGTADLIAQGKEAILNMEEDDASALHGSTSFPPSISNSVPAPTSGGKYSRFESQVRAMQTDSDTYCKEPSDEADFTKWKSSFNLSDKNEDIDNLLNQNAFLQELQLRFIPDVVSREEFWTRYFYRLHKLQQTEEARADLVKRASALNEEELSWDIEEDFDEGSHDVGSKASEVDASEKQSNHQEAVKELQEGEKTQELGLSTASTIPQAQLREASASKDISKALAEKDDISWDVPSDMEESCANDGKRPSNDDASWEVPDVSRKDIRKRLVLQEDDEDLGWDVDDVVDDKK
ncbi:hypothetical protein KP509_23G061700 [Ceratopteris richardii]|uniref:BSD domain-containing protein n=4 Tax=Ceratopteris richardii TaxID=49495 RepID=A0A8T2S146_CERRI|nr:hypothetical protein KP509_23G061700 [Ceratopteris richardii]